MNATPAQIRERVLAAYSDRWLPVFGPVADSPDRVLTQVGKALAAYERTLRPPAGPLDRYVDDLRAGRPSHALSEAEERGLYLFVGRANCVSCHSGPMLTDQSFHALGLPATNPDHGRALGAPEVLADPFNCRGRFSDAPSRCDELRYLDPKFPDWVGAFKTPSLRGVSKTAPYMHDGSFPTIEAVISFYSALSGKAPIGHRELTLQPLQLSADQQADLAAFLHVL
jgi:cytochrome c peroxidase